MAIHAESPDGVPHRTDSVHNIDNKVGGTPLTHNIEDTYKVSEHILWAPRKMRIACIGAGASGLILCYKKEKEFGDSLDLVVYDRYSACGGVWHANRYPGCRCDIPSPSYQLSFHPKPDWSRYCAPASEIQEYYHSFAKDQGYLEKYIKLRHEVTKATWNAESSQWILEIDELLGNGEKRHFQDKVDFLVSSIGVNNTWKWPDIPNRESFGGKIMHSAAYDPSVVLKDKTVIVIGSGASAVQIVPAIKGEAKKVISFYRTPQWITGGLIPLAGYTDEDGGDFSYTEEQIAAFKNNPELYLSHRKYVEDTINRGFALNLLSHPIQEAARQQIESKMTDALKGNKRLEKRLIPSFPIGCRRIGPAEGFLESFHEENVELADGDISTFTKTGLRTKEGVEYEADVIICATGFDVSFRPHFPIIGRNGESLAETWKDEPEAYLALAAHGFPNLMFGSLGPNCPAAHGSFTTVLEAAQNYVCRVIRKMQIENIRSIEVKAEVIKEYNEHAHEWLKRSVWSGGCRSWYNQGKPDGKITAQYPGSLVHWLFMMNRPRFEDYDIKYRSRNRFEFMGNGFTDIEVDVGDVSWYLNPEEVAKPLFTSLNPV
ncbi:flavin-binding monooxygenase [Colletotrichum karsti]|uniref:Flavin-binding monooxygenase n=1 Tax=Colletotrichum karsti TaxID=1095194 RepID=A0A9P6I1E9_9PEZI|nr:flavin-binding monooxygenase [Colletotrichum karsti]KAF9874299.1 flavin-binding monooxygenase [Colletotrichum karsti]